MDNIKLDKCFGCGKQNPWDCILILHTWRTSRTLSLQLMPTIADTLGSCMWNNYCAFDEAMFYAVKDWVLSQ